jgi:hypothetical protein
MMINFFPFEDLHTQMEYQFFCFNLHHHLHWGGGGHKKKKVMHRLKEAHSVSFEKFYLVMFYGNQII